MGMWIFTKSHKEAQVHHDFCISFYCLYPISHTLEARRKLQRKENLFFAKEVGNTETNEIHMSLRPDGRHPQVLRELTSVIVTPVLIIFERSW